VSFGSNDKIGFSFTDITVVSTISVVFFDSKNAHSAYNNTANSSYFFTYGKISILFNTKVIILVLVSKLNFAGI
jgi:hypothetical protein